VELVFVKFKKFNFLNFENIKKTLECSLPFVLHVCEFVFQNILYSFLS
jgi:hypothetical protein